MTSCSRINASHPPPDEKAPEACAPRYIWFSVSQPKYDDNRWNKESTVGNRREPVGTCWVASNNFNESQEYSPCRTKQLYILDYRNHVLFNVK
ncbi:Integrin alpha-5 [Acromyrmex echinatior]|uniref:Integrin alpha-5 n=1 Tax=Acromyrmex echinatior TaxID=103372 RepID=F4X1C2_ACREC|nr:Integrin alpha-5 [Acromyrmex echinatior]